MSENIVVGLIVAAAAAFVLYRFFGKKNRGKCGCGCSGCSGGAGTRQDGLTIENAMDANSSGCQHCASRRETLVDSGGSSK